RDSGSGARPRTARRGRPDPADPSDRGARTGHHNLECATSDRAGRRDFGTQSNGRQRRQGGDHARGGLDRARGEAQDRTGPAHLRIAYATGASMAYRHGFGIIGCGMIAEFHTKAINEIEDAAVVAAFSRSEANGAKIAKMAAK